MYLIRKEWQRVGPDCQTHLFFSTVFFPPRHYFCRDGSAVRTTGGWYDTCLRLFSMALWTCNDYFLEGKERGGRKLAFLDSSPGSKND